MQSIIKFLLPSVPFQYMLGSFKRRRLTMIITMGGFALVIFVYTAVLMMSYGVEKTLATGGSEQNVVVSRKSSQGEISSIIDGDAVNVILTLPQIAKDDNGRALATAEPVVVINLYKKDDGGMSNVTIRGVDETAFKVRPHAKIMDGKMFNPGTREIVVGKAVHSGFAGTDIGERIKIANDYWTIVGVMSAEGSAFESEIWGDSKQLQAAFNRQNSISTLTFRMTDQASIDEIKKAFESDRRLVQYEPKTEIKFYKEQSEMLAAFLKALGTAVTFIFSFGAIIGAVITMYTAVANRTTEIGTLRALGFRRRSVLFSFLVESVFLAIIGGIGGVALAAFLQFFSISTINFNSFSELSFAFSLSPPIIINAMIFSVFMGIIGGFFPSIRAARLKIVDALRNE